MLVSSSLYLRRWRDNPQVYLADSCPSKATVREIRWTTPDAWRRSLRLEASVIVSVRPMGGHSMKIRSGPLAETGRATDRCGTPCPAAGTRHEHRSG